MVRRAPFPRRSLPANIELFNEAIVCVCVCVAREDPGFWGGY